MIVRIILSPAYASALAASVGDQRRGVQPISAGLGAPIVFAAASEMRAEGCVLAYRCMLLGERR
jgi:hypothetical protein